MKNSYSAVFFGLIVFCATVLGLSAFQVWIISLMAKVDMSWDVLGWFGLGGVAKPILPWFLHIWQLLSAGYFCLLVVKQICFRQWCNFYGTQSIVGLIITIFSIIYAIVGLLMFFKGNAGFSTVVIAGLCIWTGRQVALTDMLAE